MSKVSINQGRQEINFEVHDYVDPWLEPETVVFQHGLGRTGRFWLPWIHPLSRRFRVVTIDLLGHGGSSQPPAGYELSIADYTSHVLAVMNRLELGRAHFVGESLGGIVGLELGANHSDRVHTLTLSSTPYLPKGGSDNLVEIGREVDANGMSAWVDKVLPDRMDWNNFPPEMYSWFREELLKTPLTFARQIEYQEQVDMEWALPKISVPTLLLIPGVSPVRANDQMRVMSERIPGARSVVFEAEKQWLYYSAAEQCVNEFLRFVESSPEQDRS